MIAAVWRLAPAAAIVVLAAGCGSSSSHGNAQNGPIVLSGTVTDGKAGLFLRSPAGSIKRLTADTEARDVVPVWSHDGRHIAFLRLMKGLRSGTGKLMVIDADGSNAHQVGNIVASAARISWSPGDDALAYTGAQSGIWTVGADGTDAKRIHGEGIDPSWSSDDRIVVTQPPKGLMTMNADGSDVRLLVRSRKPDKALLPDSYLAPAWSPDGTRVAYVRQVWVQQSNFLYPATLETVDADGNGRRIVTKLHSADGADFTWSPDGRQIAFTDVRPASIGLFRVASDGGTPKNLIPSASYFMPSWGPAGT